MKRGSNLLVAWLLAVCSGVVRADDGASAISWPEPTGIVGTVVLCAAEDLPESLQRECHRLRESDQARVVRLHAGGADLEALPGAIVTTANESDVRQQLVAKLIGQPRRVGISLGDNAALVVRGRQMQVIGEGSVTVVLAACAGRPVRQLDLKPGQQHDWTVLRRAAIERSLGVFPPTVAPAPRVESGSLVVVGGGTLPREITSKFIELAGGPEAPIVVLPIAAGDELPEDSSGDTRVLTRAGATNVRSLRARTKEEIESPEFMNALKEARGVWFNGGRQWRFIDAYQGTQAEELFREVLRRGGVIGGSSAGASIQSQYMPRGSPLGNEEMCAEGYERGLGFLPGTAIDQHFTQRRRHRDMSLLMRRYPQLLGIGIDEGTALVVHGTRAEIIGRGRAYFYDYREGPPAGEPDYTAASSGQTYELARRELER